MSRLTKLMWDRFAVTCNWRLNTCRDRDSVVRMVTRWRARRSGVRIPAGKKGFFSMPKPPNRALSRGKAAGAWSWLLTFIHCRGYEWLELYLCCNYMPSCSGQEKLYFFFFVFFILVFRQSRPHWLHRKFNKGYKIVKLGAWMILTFN